MTVEQVMTRAVACCHPSEKLLDAAARMHHEDLACLVVVADDGPRRRVLGLLSDRDLVRSVAREDTPLPNLDVGEAMAEVPACCAPGDPLLVALRLMGEHASTRLPVVEADGGLAGIVSLGDIARAVARLRGGEGEWIRREICRGLAGRSRAIRRGGER